MSAIYVKLLNGDVLPLTVSSLTEAQTEVASHLSTDRTVVLFPLKATASADFEDVVDALDIALQALEGGSDTVEPPLVSGGHYGAIVRDPIGLFSSIEIVRSYAYCEEFVPYRVSLYGTEGDLFAEVLVFYEVDTMLFHSREYVLTTPSDRDALCGEHSSSSLADVLMRYDLPIPWYERATVAKQIEEKLFCSEVEGDREMEVEVYHWSESESDAESEELEEEEEEEQEEPAEGCVE